MQEVKPTLYHLWCEPLEKFLQRIDEFGGWPVNAKQVIYKHTGETQRPCYFSTTEREVRDEWNTTVCFADDYYRWKLTPAAIEKVRKEVKQELVNQLNRFIIS